MDRLMVIAKMHGEQLMRDAARARWVARARRTERVRWSVHRPMRWLVLAVAGIRATRTGR